MWDETLRTARILIVDDQEANVSLLKAILSRAGYSSVASTTDPREVLALCVEFEPDLILLDLHMPHLDGFEVMQQLGPHIIEQGYLPTVMLTADITPEAKQQALSRGARDFLTKPFDATEVMLRIRNLLETRFLHLELKGQNRILEEKVRERTQEVEGARNEILERLALAAEYRDDDTGQHIHRVGDMSANLADLLGSSEAEVELIKRTAPLHDVGKIGVSDAVLLKPGKLTAEEFEHVKKHTIIGAGILSGGRHALLRMSEQIALTHHERWDGTGYPGGLTGEAIPRAGRIVAVADVFDALTHERPYKKAWPADEAVAEIVSQRARHFDPEVVDVFVELARREGFPASSLRPRTRRSSRTRRTSSLSEKAQRTAV